MGGNRGPSRALVESAAVGLFILRGAGKPRALAAGRGCREVLRRREAALPGTTPPTGSALRAAELRYRAPSGEIRPGSIALDVPGQ